MKFFLDENFPKAAIRLLKSRGHQTIDIRGTKKEGLNDKSIFKMAQKSQAVFLTTDKDFFHTIPYLYNKHHGVAVITIKHPNRENILSKLKWFLNYIEGKEIHDRVYLLKDNTFSVYSNT